MTGLSRKLPNDYDAPFPSLELLHRYPFSTGMWLWHLFRFESSGNPNGYMERASRYWNNMVAHDTPPTTLNAPDPEAIQLLDELAYANWQNIGELWALLSKREAGQATDNEIADCFRSIYTRVRLEHEVFDDKEYRREHEAWHEHEADGATFHAHNAYTAATGRRENLLNVKPGAGDTGITLIVRQTNHAMAAAITLPLDEADALAEELHDQARNERLRGMIEGEME